MQDDEDWVESPPGVFSRRFFDGVVAEVEFKDSAWSPSAFKTFASGESDKSAMVVVRPRNNQRFCLEAAQVEAISCAVVLRATDKETA